MSTITLANPAPLGLMGFGMTAFLLNINIDLPDAKRGARLRVFIFKTAARD
jgi:succinate-acetate transporter protein